LLEAFIRRARIKNSRGRMRPGSKVYATRIAFAITAGLLSALINPMTLNVGRHGVVAAMVPVLIAALLYAASYYFARSVIRVSPSSLNDPSYMYKGGAFTYVVVWIVTWSLAATLCFPSLLQQ